MNNGREVLESPLVYKDGNYQLDYDDLENKLVQSETTLMIFAILTIRQGMFGQRQSLRKLVSFV